MIVKIKLLEPIHAGAKQVSGVDDIGADAVYATVMPSTAIGVLASLAGVRGGDPFQICRQLWGPLVEVDGRLYFQAASSLYPVEEVGKYIAAAKGEGEPPKARYEVVELERPGVRLRDKVVQNLYYAKYLWVKGAREVAYLYYADCEGLRGGVEWVGGEGRVAVVEVQSDDKVAPKPCREGVLLSPLLFYADWPYAEVGKSVGLQDVEEVYGVLEGGRAKVKSTYVGLGYSLSLRRRRAIYQALPQGTALRLREPAPSAGLHKERGYGSLLCP